MRKSTSILLLLFSASLVGVGLMMAWRDNQRESLLTRTDGWVAGYREVGIGRGRPQRKRFFPRVEFATSDGASHAFESNVALSAMKYGVGQRVTVLYDSRSETPGAHAEIEGVGLKMPFVIYYIAFGIGLIGAIGAYRSTRPGRKSKLSK
ncbi:DUF3592 domain-containing protein [Lysobacter brunescens]|uniref:DUF3592 domain-containing protein n=1 Tax=Lysobacter brunescens TaxID=262323 RepID=A0ABW2YDC5_9GAMM